MIAIVVEGLGPPPPYFAIRYETDDRGDLVRVDRYVPEWPDARVSLRMSASSRQSDGGPADG